MRDTLSPRQQVVRAALVLLGLVGLAGGTLQLLLGQPETTPRLDNVHRFMAGIYLGSALIALWAGVTIARQGRLVQLVALAVLLGGAGRLVSMVRVGVPEPAALWWGYLAPELLLPILILLLHRRAPGAP